jgi:diaminopimelate decarboxylase
MKSALPFSKITIEKLTDIHPTPFYIYDEKGIREGAKFLKEAFANVGLKHKNFFAVKALPNPHILKILAECGMGADCSSLAELILAEKAGLSRENIFLTSNNTPAEEFREAARLGAIINFDDISHLAYYKKHLGELPKIGCARYNPGDLKDGNSIIGKPLEAKFGATREQIIEMYEQMQSEGIKRFGIHTMVASNSLEPTYLIDTARILFELIREIYQKTGIIFEFANLGGGFGIPYQPDQLPLDIIKVAQGIKKHHDNILLKAGHPPIQIYTENGRWITGPHGYLVARAIHFKNTYKNYIGLDASMANLMRPGMYGAYHHITVLGKENSPLTNIYDIVGSLCENNDKFAIDRNLPKIKTGDLLVIQDTGAHAHSMGFNYNGKLRSAEFLLKEDNSYQIIRRAESIEDYFATLI